MKNAVASMPPKRGWKIFNLSVSALVGLGILGASSENARAIVYATEITQVLNKVLLGKQLTEQEVHTEKLFAIDEQTMRAIMGQRQNTHGMNEAAMDIARQSLGSLGVPYEMRSALLEYQNIFMFDPSAVVSQSTVMPIFGGFMDAQDQAAQESIAAITEQQRASEEARVAVERQISLSQGSEGTTQALMAGNQIAGAQFGKLDQIQVGLQAGNYMEARRVAAEQADLRAAYVQRNFDTRDFITGPYQSAGAGQNANTAAGLPIGFSGM